MISYQNILEACNNPPRRSNKRSSEASKTPCSNSDHHDTSNHSSTEDLFNIEDIHCHSNGHAGEYNASCCGINSNGNKPPHNNKHGGNQRTSSTKYNHNKRIMVEPVILPCNHGYCQECITHMTDMVSHLSSSLVCLSCYSIVYVFSSIHISSIFVLSIL